MDLHVTSSFLPAHPDLYWRFFNAAEEAEVCSEPRNYKGI